MTWAATKIDATALGGLQRIHASLNPASSSRTCDDCHAAFFQSEHSPHRCPYCGSDRVKETA